MPSAVAPNPRANPDPADDLDDLFNYDAGIDETFNQLGQQIAPANREDLNEITGLDEEVKITRKRRPLARLDEDRLLSDAGIPKLRKISKDRLRFQGKGHEFSDMARLLSTYQLWLDDLFPKAKFTDGLSMIEKLGHKKRIQIMRKEWINEGKPKPSNEDDEEDAFVPAGSQKEQSQDHRDAQEPTLTTRISQADSQSKREDVDLHNVSQSNDELLQHHEQVFEDQEPDEDELDALLAEDVDNAPKSLFGGPTSTGAGIAQPMHNDYEDDEEAMAGMDW
ncbi:hypothetical protein MBLNU459_g1194t1 [Dothideomycetes sp. NU459]